MFKFDNLNRQQSNNIPQPINNKKQTSQNNNPYIYINNLNINLNISPKHITDFIQGNDNNFKPVKSNTNTNIEQEEEEEEEKGWFDDDDRVDYNYTLPSILPSCFNKPMYLTIRPTSPPHKLRSRYNRN